MHLLDSESILLMSRESGTYWSLSQLRAAWFFKIEEFFTGFVPEKKPWDTSKAVQPAPVRPPAGF